MGIQSLRDGFVQLCFDTSLNIYGTKKRVVLEGQYIPSGHADALAVDQLHKLTVTDFTAIDNRLGAGSVLAESVKTFQSQCSSGVVDLFVLPRADNGTTKATYTLTIANNTTSAGRYQIIFGEARRYAIDTYVASGQTPTQVATAIKASIDALKTLPFEVTAAAGVLTFTARNAGTVGNGFNPTFNWRGNPVTPGGTTLTWAQTVQGATNPAALADYNSLVGDCCVSEWGLLSDDVTWQNGPINYVKSQWDCDNPQCFGHLYTYNHGSLGQVLATDSNSAEASRRPTNVASNRILGYLRTAAMVGKTACVTADNPEISVQGQTFGVLDAIAQAESCTPEWTYAERQQLAAAGFAVDIASSAGTGGLASPQVTHDITNNRFDANFKANATFRSVVSRRMARVTAEKIAEKVNEFNGFGYYSAGTRIQDGVQGININLIRGQMRTWMKSQVGVLFGEFDNLDEDLLITEDMEDAAACQGVPGKFNIKAIYRPPVRTAGASIQMQPKLLDNC